ncbi:HAD-IIB family hydrolase [Flavimaricola marinus]|uniref:Mannosylfructose-phosphate phosphatase n=1 Tax=Flavimaricola marinus TaxID=1819565 RepID=A0A238LH06_9RHOB|nr:HAD-IIB family hydrolase [Flavimaricola marinus]SMY08931.1 Mannosylfructose-phosphate phosphatase [Flavimaricola marinus]
MTRHETFHSHSIDQKSLVLATDLDGTFLGGTDEDRRKFYSWIEANRDRVGLIFVTGRDPGFIRDLTRNRGVPRPDYVIGDVGTTIAEMTTDHFVSPIAELEREIEEAWGNAGARVHAALQRFEGLSAQSTVFRYRVSYDMDPSVFDDAVLDIVAELGLDALISDNRYMDVLPKGVSKGPSLLRLLSHLGIDSRCVLVAGDTLNDLSMLCLGVPAVAVGGSEPALIEKVKGMEHVHVATAVGVAGIAEAIMTGQMFPKQKEVS